MKILSKELNVRGNTYHYFSLTDLEIENSGKVARLPVTLKILLENLLRQDAGRGELTEQINALINWKADEKPSNEIPFMPARVLLQDFTGVPAVVDLAVMRDAVANMGGDPSKINPQLPAELVIDHSVQVDVYANHDAFRKNVEIEYQRNKERYAFLRWGQGSFDNLQVVPPGTGIVHQVNLEYLARAVFDKKEGAQTLAYPDTLVGTDSHTTMVNGLGVLAWGVGGIEAEAAMLGQPISLLVPQVVGFKLTGKMLEGATATDLVLTVTEQLRAHGVVGKFVEFFGSGLQNLTLADRATISNMSPEYGATCGFFPIDQEALNYLKFSGRDEKRLALVESYCKAQGIFATGNDEALDYSVVLELDLGSVTPSLAGPSRPQDRFALSDAKNVFNKIVSEKNLDMKKPAKVSAGDMQFELNHGDVVIAAITSCTNTSNPAVMLAAGLLAKNAVDKGLSTPAWVKTSLAPGSMVVTDYLKEAGVMEPLEKLGFHLVGYGCTTCIGNSGPLPTPVANAIRDHDLYACSVLSGNRNFEGRINPLVRGSFLASPPLVVAYALAGTIHFDPYHEPIGQDSSGNDVFLKDIWPSNQDIADAIKASVKSEMFTKEYAGVFKGDDLWQALPSPKSERYEWQDDSTYIKAPTFFDGMSKEAEAIAPLENMRLLALLGDSVTTDHISPAGAIPIDEPAGRYLKEKGVKPIDFNTFGSRRGNHEVMMRGTFGNIRLRNQLVPGVEGGYTTYNGKKMAIYDAAMEYAKTNTSLIIIAGKEYGTGSSRDWAAKGTRLLGVKAVIAESFERIHRSNLIGMGVLPLQFEAGTTAASLKLAGNEKFSLRELNDQLKPGQILHLTIEADGQSKSVPVTLRIDTANELEYYRHGGILHYVLRQLVQ